MNISKSVCFGPSLMISAKGCGLCPCSVEFAGYFLRVWALMKGGERFPQDNIQLQPSVPCNPSSSRTFVSTEPTEGSAGWDGWLKKGHAHHINSSFSLPYEMPCGTSKVEQSGVNPGAVLLSSAVASPSLYWCHFQLCSLPLAAPTPHPPSFFEA